LQFIQLRMVVGTVVGTVGRHNRCIVSPLLL
jgi:hypothetical protein